MPPSRLRLADRVLDGRLAELLTEWRSDGVSYEMCARRLSALLGEDESLTGQTVRVWCGELGVRSEAKAAS